MRVVSDSKEEAARTSPSKKLIREGTAIAVGMLEQWAGRARVTLNAAGEGAARAYSGAKEGGIIPSKLEVTGDGSLIPPTYVWWAPWAVRGGIVLAVTTVAWLTGLAAGGGGYPLETPMGAFAAALLGALGLAVMGFKAETPIAWGACVLVIPFLIGVLTESTALAVVFAILGAIAAFIGGVYRRADFDAATIEALEQITAARRNHGRGYLLEEILEDDGGHEKLLTLGDPDGGAPRNSRIRHVPDGVREGWYIVVDPARRFMAGMPPAMLRRVESLGDPA